MPYISKEEVAAKRKALKKALPEYKFQVRMKNHCKIMVRILQGPIQLTDDPNGYEDVNHYYIDEHFEGQPEVHRVLSKTYNILTHDQGQEVYDMDYGSVPNFYIAITIGTWDKPYHVINGK